MLKLPIYMDYHATTPVDPRVLEAMLPYLTTEFGNPAIHTHPFGWHAAEAVERARKQVATLIGATAKEIIFTSGATESNNLAIKGVARAYRDRGDHVITAATEHHAVLDSCRCLQEEGFRVTCLPVGSDGLIDLGDLERAITSTTILVSVMAANNEIGVIQPIGEIGRITKRHGVLFHTDCAQAAGRIPLDVGAMQIDLLSMSAHKMYGAKGVGALYVRRQDPPVGMSPQIHGGGHERGVRSGTLNVPGIVAFGQAAEICRRELPAEQDRLRALRDRLLDGLRASVPDIRVNGSLEHRLAGNLNVSFFGVAGRPLLLALSDVAVSSGAACSSGAGEPSHVLTAIGLDADRAHASIRFGLGRFNTEEEVDYVITQIQEVVQQLRRGPQDVDVPDAEGAEARAEWSSD
jgi:cysteine desulfurase